MSARHTEMAQRRWEKLDSFAYPQTIIDRARLLRKFHSQADTAAILKVSREYIRQLERRGFQVGKGGRPTRARPGDFAIQCNCMTKHELARHYGASLSTIEQWLVGIERSYEPRKVVRAAAVPPLEVIVEAMSGRSFNEARDHLGVCNATFLKWRRHHGLPITPWKGKRS